MENSTEGPSSVSAPLPAETKRLIRSFLKTRDLLALRATSKGTKSEITLDEFATDSLTLSQIVYLKCLFETVNLETLLKEYKLLFEKKEMLINLAIKLEYIAVQIIPAFEKHRYTFGPKKELLTISDLMPLGEKYLTVAKQILNFKATTVEQQISLAVSHLEIALDAWNKKDFQHPLYDYPNNEIWCTICCNHPEITKLAFNNKHLNHRFTFTQLFRIAISNENNAMLCLQNNNILQQIIMLDSSKLVEIIRSSELAIIAANNSFFKERIIADHDALIRLSTKDIVWARIFVDCIKENNTAYSVDTIDSNNLISICNVFPNLTAEILEKLAEFSFKQPADLEHLKLINLVTKNFKKPFTPSCEIEASQTQLRTQSSSPSQTAVSALNQNTNTHQNPPADKPAKRMRVR